MHQNTAAAPAAKPDIPAADDGPATPPTLLTPGGTLHAVDHRESLANGGEIGPTGTVSLPECMITFLRGIMLDFDPDRYRADRLPPGATASPDAFYYDFVGPMLDRHPVYASAEVRDTGRGLHALIRFDPPVAFSTARERTRWAGVVRAVQRALPTDPDAPGITALTRPVGSINGKTGRPVRVLTPGRPVVAGEVLGLVEELRTRPFATVAGIVFGGRPTPCPVCRKPGTTLGVMDRGGTCYGGCGKVSLRRLFDAIYAPRAAAEGG